MAKQPTSPPASRRKPKPPPASPVTTYDKIIEEIDQRLFDFWGDYPHLAVSMRDPRKDTNAFVFRIVDEALSEGLVLDAKLVAERASRALSMGQGWRK